MLVVMIMIVMRRIRIRSLPQYGRVRQGMTGDQGLFAEYHRLVVVMRQEGKCWLARHSTIKEMGPPHRLDL